MEFNSHLKKITSDPVIIASLLVSLVLMALSGRYLFQEYIPNNRIKIIDQSYTKNLSKTRNEVDYFIKSTTSQLRAIAEKQNITQLMRDINKDLLDGAELEAEGQVPDVEDLFFIDKNFLRHNEELSSAASAFLRDIKNDGKTRAKAIRVAEECFEYTANF